MIDTYSIIVLTRGKDGDFMENFFMNEITRLLEIIEEQNERITDLIGLMEEKNKNTDELIENYDKIINSYKKQLKQYKEFIDLLGSRLELAEQSEEETTK